MKILIFIASWLIFTSALAESSPPFHHSHSGREHTHSLPQQGLAHRHGSLGLGRAIKSDQEKAVTQLPPQAVPENLRKGETHCRAGSFDCNPCAINVQQQFKKVTLGKIVWRTKPWRFTWSQPYPPTNLRPLDIFDGDPAYALGIPDTHVQGFVRTYSRNFPYAGSHSHKQKGGIFVVTQLNDGKKYLKTLHSTFTKHPSGVHILGKYLVYGENSHLVFKDLNSPNQQQNITLKIPLQNGNAPELGGGLGLLKLAKGRYLLVLSGPGGQDNRPRFNQFYHLHYINGKPHHLTFINRSQTTKPQQWSNKFIYSENLSLMTECGTGDIYAIHTSGDQKGIKAINGNGYWRLSKLLQRYGQLSFKPVNAFITRQNMTSCNVRATATAFITPQHQLELYCHGYAKDPDGSVFNILGQSNSRIGKFYFRVGVIQ